MWWLWLGCGLWSAAPEIPHTRFERLDQAVASVLRSDTRVIAVGEVHVSTEGPTVPSTLTRFTDDLLVALAPRLTDLVFETWVVDGSCGGEDVAVADAVQEGTARPEATETEIARASRRARELGVNTHALSMSCDDVASIQGPQGIRYGVLLDLLTAKLATFADEALALEEGTVLLYGGAVHNDVAPSADLARYSYAHTRRGRLVELDLYVPELLESRDAVDAPWWPLVAEATGPDHVVLIERSPDSFVILLPRTVGR